MTEKIDVEKTIVCRVDKGGKNVACDIYRGGELIERKVVPKEKLEEVIGSE